MEKIKNVVKAVAAAGFGLLAGLGVADQDTVSEMLTNVEVILAALGTIVIAGTKIVDWVVDMFTPKDGAK